MIYSTISEKTPIQSAMQNLRSDAVKLDCSSLLALGVSPHDAKVIIEILEISTLAKRYRHQLYRQGVNREDARRIAKAIAQYDIAGKTPTPPYQTLIRHYCSTICRLGLWRSQLLLPEAMPSPVVPTSPASPPYPTYKDYSYDC